MRPPRTYGLPFISEKQQRFIVFSFSFFTIFESGTGAGAHTPGIGNPVIS